MFKTTHAAAIAALAGCASVSIAQTDIFWNAGSSNWNTATNWNPVNVPNIATESAHILGPAFINVNLDVTVSILDLEVGPNLTLTLDPARGLSLAGDIDNTGFITINPTASTSTSFIQFNSNATISGSGGILRLSNDGNDAQLTTNGTTVTNAAGHTIDGAGQILASLINNGVVSAIDTGFGSRLELFSSGKTNNSTMQAGPNAELFINNVTITQGVNGFIGANSDGLVSFNGNTTIAGGTIGGAGSLLRPGSGNLTLTGVSLENDLPVEANSGIVYSGETFNCTGTITLNDSGSASNSFIQFNSSTMISGGGTIFLAGGGAPGAANDSQVTTNGTTITITPGFTIEGSGEIPASLINNGLVRAFPSTNGDGRIRLFSSGKTNNTQIVADPGGVIEISNVTITQDTEGAGGELLADGGEIELVGNNTITGGTIRTINGGTIDRTISGNTTLNDVVIDADFPVANNSGIIYIGATLDCSGTITLNDTDSSTNSFIQFNSSTTITCGGRVFLAGGGLPGGTNDSQVTTNGTTLTVAPDFTIEGSGEIPASLINNGLVRAFPSTNGDGRIRLFSSTKTNNTQFVADPGGVIEVSNVTITQAPDAELLADAGEIELVGNNTITGGTIRTANGGAIDRATSGNTTLTDVVIDADIPVAANSGIFYSGDTFDCTGTITLNDSQSSSNAFIQFNSNSTATGGGTIFLAGGGLPGGTNDSQVTTNGTTLTVAPGFTIEGSGEIPASLVNNGLVRAFPSTNGDGRIKMFSSTKTNNTQFLADTGGIIELNNVVITQNTEGGAPGEIIADGGAVEFVGNSTVNGGVIRAINGGTLTRPISGNLSLADITLEGDLDVHGGSGIFYNSVQFINNASVVLDENLSTSNAFMQFNANTVITGDGTIVLAGGGDNSQLATNGTTATLGPDQTLEGEGIVTGTYIFEGVVAPGLPVGDITGSGNVTFNPTALLDIEADGDPGANDSLDRTGTINLGGTLRFRFLDSIVPGVFPAVYTVASASTINGEFDAIDLPAPIQPGTAVYVGHDGSDVFVAFTCKADVSPPFGLLDLSDVTAFVSAFLANDPLADLAEPFGLFDLADVLAFVQGFQAGCD